jgi:hypothetical protein
VTAELGIYGKRVLAWAKSLFALGKRLATLEARVSALEAVLGKHPPDGEREMRKNANSPGVVDAGRARRLDVWICEKCGRSEERIVRF